jgi:predicted O-methyltransferase YrrM
LRAALAAAGLEAQVIAVVGRSAQVAALWRTPLGMLFIDGGQALRTQIRGSAGKPAPSAGRE